ncbi:MAG: hypothetical protein CVT92_11895 [Bacteroidetes bacterium HGW-Bacteroidetes-1]|jgi:hypothetical protein|nr:MAG: hypothetical protein CVT92_11895 [Bacteroidetes bacterium HGW-Bacteroidetes-1]
MLKQSFLLISIMLTIGTLAQNQISGIVSSAKNRGILSGVQITIENTTIGTISDINGKFTIKVDQLPEKIILTHIGFQSQKLEINSKNFENELIVLMIPTSIELEEVNILSDAAKERYNPIAFNRISSEKIVTTLGDKPLPEVMNFSPGVFASRDGGGSGDATLSIRGFQQENIAVLLNGVPINGAENGLVYWNNWMGLTEVASEIQVQRGIGASKVALNSVGGTVNIITYHPKAEQGGVFSYQLTDYGNQKTTLSYNTGISDKGWGVSFYGSRTKGNGYIDGTYVDGWAYYLSVSKNFKDNQRVLITLMGGPEKHGQRNFKLSKEEVDQYGFRFNKEWGSYNGKINNASENFYHKPHLSLTHYLSINNRSLFATSLYFSPGWGGGKWNDSFNYGPNIFSFRNPSGQIDWEEIYAYNSSNTDSFTLENGQTISGFSKVIQTYFLASHVWTGAISTFETDLNATTKLISGVHYRFFQSQLMQQVADLLGGSSYIDDYSWSNIGVSDREQIKLPGDIIRLHNGARLHQTTLFTQLEKNIGKVNVFGAISLSDNRFRRHDIYNYPDNKWSELQSKPGFDVKAGLNYNINATQNLFFNIAHFSKAPYYKYVFGNNTNTPVENISNEKVSSAEAGYAIRNQGSQLLFSAYYTFWNDVSFLSNEYIQLEHSNQTRAMVNGLSALHKGLELEYMIKLSPSLKLGGLISTGNWKWQKDVEANIFNDNDIVVDTVNVYAKGLYVGGQPQFQAGILLQAKFLKTGEVTFSLIHYDRHFAQFDPTGRQSSDDRTQSFRLPSYTLANVNLNYPFMIIDQKVNLFITVNNLFDHHYIVKGEDGIGHNLETFRGFWSFGRTFDMGIRWFF